MKNWNRRVARILFGFTLLTVTSGCGQGTVVSSSAFQSAFSIARLTLDPIDEFKFCVARVRLEAEGGVSADDDSNTLQFTPGLIDLTSGEAVDWGTITVPEEISVARIKVKVKKDASACGADYSVLYNGLSTPRDIEFRWKFDPPVTVSATTQALRLSFEQIVAALQSSAMSDELQLKDRIEAIEGEAEVE